MFSSRSEQSLSAPHAPKTREVVRPQKDIEPAPFSSQATFCFEAWLTPSVYKSGPAEVKNFAESSRPGSQREVHTLANLECDACRSLEGLTSPKL